MKIEWKKKKPGEGLNQKIKTNIFKNNKVGAAEQMICLPGE